MIVVTGATGRTGGAAAKALLANGETVRVVGRDAKKLDAFVQNGAEAFIGNVEDQASMIKAFQGADAIYLVVPEDTTQEDLRSHQEQTSDSFAAAIAAACVPYVVSLSSIGAQHAENTGPIVGLHNLEQKLNRISGLDVLHLRAAYFMENLLLSMSPLRSMGMLPGGLKSDVPMPWIATKDIGAYAAKRLVARDFSGSSNPGTSRRARHFDERGGIRRRRCNRKPKLSYMQVPFMMLEPALVQMDCRKARQPC